MFKNMKIRNRMLLGFAIIVILLIVISIFSIMQLHRIALATTNLYNHPYTVSNSIRDAEIRIIKIQRSLRDIILSENVEDLENVINRIKVLEKETEDFLNIARKQFLGDKEEYFGPLFDNLEKWKPIREKMIELVNAGQKTEAHLYNNKVGVVHADNIKDLLGKVTHYADQRAREFHEGALDSERKTYIVVGIIDALAIIMSIWIAMWMTSSITRPLHTASNMMKRLSIGDLAVDIASYSRDELGIMLSSMKEMSTILRTQMRQLSESISVLSGSAAEISSTTAQFASTSQQVATSVNEVMVSMREVKQTTELSNDKARQMAAGARNVVETSRNGQQAVQQTISAINSIQEQMMSIADSVVGLSEQSQSIGEIIAAVDDVADQSRLLAVNASIEAVKAGEQGKGFSVVADEIKSLAEQSKQSTSQVRTILTDIQKATSAAVMATEKGSKAVERGVKQASQTGSAIDTLGENIEQTSQAAVQIEASSRQQTAGIDQVFSAMESINNAIAQSAESARQLERSTRDLDDLGKQIKLIVEKYNI